MRPKPVTRQLPTSYNYEVVSSGERTRRASRSFGMVKAARHEILEPFEAPLWANFPPANRLFWIPSLLDDAVELPSTPTRPACWHGSNAAATAWAAAIAAMIPQAPGPLRYLPAPCPSPLATELFDEELWPCVVHRGFRASQLLVLAQQCSGLAGTLSASTLIFIHPLNIHPHLLDL